MPQVRYETTNHSSDIAIRRVQAYAIGDIERKITQMTEQEVSIKEQVAESVTLYKEERGPLIAILQDLQRNTS